MSNCRVLCILAIVLIVLSATRVYGGPARSFQSVVSRTAKIPRAIRAPYRNNEIMTARGFGKRSQQMIKFKDDNLLKSDTDIPWLNEKFNGQDDNGLDRNLLNAQYDKCYPIEWFVQKMSCNEDVMRSLLLRYADVNHDGQISLRELFTGVPSPLYNEFI